MGLFDFLKGDSRKIAEGYDQNGNKINSQIPTSEEDGRELPIIAEEGVRYVQVDPERVAEEQENAANARFDYLQNVAKKDPTHTRPDELRQERIPVGDLGQVSIGHEASSSNSDVSAEGNSTTKTELPVQEIIPDQDSTAQEEKIVA